MNGELVLRRANARPPAVPNHPVVRDDSRASGGAEYAEAETVTHRAEPILLGCD